MITQTIDGTKFRQVRESRGIPVAALARAVGRSASLIYSIEAGRTQPSAEVFRLCCLFLQVDPASISTHPREPMAAAS
ncbi:helix-turn-helix domain-containing protein [Streptomonospora salina]|uniref:Transcriptional regulator with XRE-family HTH domain n=1 Tax=Streptomonospora salina TaxID=104205 RepID=A0A841EKI9_9ACTN|nr:helix-turn-helix transcriptional regulator [Streptomonospora salina]MBB6000850.1 transcriptional regulator with XRE-family HTH domain [Streptomonospora salina]